MTTFPSKHAAFRINSRMLGMLKGPPVEGKSITQLGGPQVPCEKVL